MTAVRLRIVTVECDSAEPAVMNALRDLLEQFRPSTLVLESAGLAPAPVNEAAPAAVPRPSPEQPRRGPGRPRKEPAAPPPERPLRVANDAPFPKADPTGRVEGVAAPTAAPGSELARLLDLVVERPGITVHELARITLGSASPHNTRRVDMQIGPAVMSGRLVRTNGRLYGSAAQAAAAPPPPLWPHGKAGQAAPLNDVQRKKDAFNAVVEAFTGDPAYPLPKLAERLFGDSEPRSLRKLQLMLTQLCATERLDRIGQSEYRAVGATETVGRGLDDEPTEDDTDTESNGHADDGELEELDLE